MKRLAAAAVMFVFVGLVSPVRAAGDPTGTWWWMEDPDVKMRPTTLTLKLDGDKLTGVIVRFRVPGGKIEKAIEDATINGDQIRFKVTSDSNGEKRTANFEGKLSGDTIKGFKANIKDGKFVGGRSWEAKRQK